MRRDRRFRGEKSAVGLIDANEMRWNLERREAAHQFCGIEDFVWQSMLPRSLRGPAYQGAVRRADLDDPGHRQQPLPRIGFKLAPERV